MAITRLTRPITVADIAECLGESTFNVGKLCISDKVSAWAKYKPVRLADNPIFASASWWQADQNINNDCGFRIPIHSLNSGLLNNASLIAEFTEDGTNGWNYLKPTGSYWKRVLDFDGYYHYAGPPFSLISNTINVYEGTEEVSIIPVARVYQGDDVLKIKDFAFAANSKYYLGAFLVGSVNGTTYYRRDISSYEVTAENSGEIGSTGTTLPTLPIGDLPTGTYTIYTIIGSQSIGYDANGNEEANQTISVLPCPCVPPITLNIVEKNIVFPFTIGGILSRTTLEIRPSFTFSNQSIGDVIITDLKFMFLPDGADSTATSTINIGSRDVAFGDNYDYSDDLQQTFFATSGYTNPWLKVQFKVKDVDGNFLNEYGEVADTVFERAVIMKTSIN